MGSYVFKLQTPFVPNFTEDDMSEDCLTLNIFTNDMNMNKSKPVMIWIHGGAFYLGSKDRYRMQPLIDEDVILVAMNYRLHALGFMSFGNSLVSGNMGLKDQQLAIQWVRKNIGQFGGDPERLVLFGESAGAISVQAHVLSPFNKGINFSGIAQSGSILYLSIETPGIEKKFARNAAEALGCPTSLDQEALNCLQNVDSKYLVANITDSDELQFDPVTDLKFSYWPNIDDYADDPFLPMDPLLALKNGSFNMVPYITGTVKNEGAFVNRAYGVFGAEGKDAVKAVEFPAKTGFLLNYGQYALFNKVTLDFYNHSSGESQYELEKPAIDFASDTQFLSYDQKSAEIMNSHMSSVYNFYFTQKTNRSEVGEMLGLPMDYTPIHGDDEAFLVFTESSEDITGVSDEELDTSKKMIKYWTNFAKYGNPNSRTIEDEKLPVWYPYNQDEKNYLDLKAEPEMKKNIHPERMYFWNKMIWEEKESLVERQQLYQRATTYLKQQFL